jgi:hypothetical protein
MMDWRKIEPGWHAAWEGSVFRGSVCQVGGRWHAWNADPFEPQPTEHATIEAAKSWVEAHVARPGGEEER